DEMNLPVCSMVANFPNPNTGNGLMTFDEVETLFHEFGHVLHNGIGKSKFARFWEQMLNGILLKHQVKSWNTGYGRVNA
ncbi:M3 family metallopeptidase, partial [Acidimicrobiia bacterium]|nr:M3 family metallopeptidase [Acidimicrobiia bacterium]